MGSVARWFSELRVELDVVGRRFTRSSRRRDSRLNPPAIGGVDGKKACPGRVDSSLELHCISLFAEVTEQLRETIVVQLDCRCAALSHESGLGIGAGLVPDR